MRLQNNDRVRHLAAPAWHRSLLAAPARHSPRHLPSIEASSLPSLRQGEFFPAKKMSRLSSRPTTLKNNFQVVLWGDNCLKFQRTCPAEPRQPDMEGTPLMSLTNYEAVSGFAGHWLHRAQVSLLTGEIGQIKLSHIRKKKPWCGPSLQREVEVLVNFAEGAQTVSSFKFAGQVKAKTCHFKFPGPGRPAHHPAREAPGRACPALKPRQAAEPPPGQGI